MQIDDYTSRGHLRRWMILDGQPRCPHNPVDPWCIPDEAADVILAQNAAVREKIEAVVAYEAAFRLRSGEAPDRYEEVADAEGGEPVRRETEAYKAWRDAGKVVDEASAETLELAAIRAGALSEDGEAREPDPIPEDTLAIWAPVPPTVPAFHGRIVLRAAGLYAGAMAALNVIADPMQKAIALEGFEGANDWSRGSPMIATAGAALNLQKEQVNELFRQAAQVKV